MSWWQKKLLRYGLRYGLARTGLLNDEALDLDNLDVTIGSKNVIELKDVGLNIERISKLAHLPTGVRLETARAILLRLTIPADFYQSSIIAEVDGVEIDLNFIGKEHETQQHRKAEAASPTDTRTPQHRKTPRRLYSPPTYRRGSSSDQDEEVHIPTTQEVAKSFLRDESLLDRRELEASVAANSSLENMDDSLVSEGSSSSSELGTGMSIGLPGFLANFLQGLVDRFVVIVKNVEIKIEADIGVDPQCSVPVTLRLRLASIHLDKLDQSRAGNASDVSIRRAVQMSNISLDLLTEAPSPLQQVDSLDNPPLDEDQQQSHSFHRSEGSYELSETSSPKPNSREDFDDRSTTAFHSQHAELQNQMTTEPYKFASETAELEDETADGLVGSTAQVDSDLEIQPGDDNISWGSRRSQSNAPAEDLWSSIISEDPLPDSLLIEPERASTPRAHSSREDSPSSIRSRRQVSPYDRAFRSPGSWPTLEDIPAQPRSQSIRSWPGIGQSQNSTVEPLAHVLESSLYRVTDNKKEAIETGPRIEQSEEQAYDTRSSQDEDMLQSRFFSHEEAQSMYLSAMTSGPGVESTDQWAAKVADDASSSDLQNVHSSELTNLPDAVDIEADSCQAARDQPSGNVTPRAQTPRLASLQEVEPASPECVTKQIFSVDALTILLPSAGDKSPDVGEVQPLTTSSLQKSNYQPRGMPGTFSAYSDLSSSRRGLVGSTAEDLRIGASSRDNLDTVTAVPIGLEIGQVRLLLDMPSIKLLCKIYRRVNATMEDVDKQSQTKKSKTPEPNEDHPDISVSIAGVSLSILHDLESHVSSNPSITHDKNEIISLHIGQLSCRYSSATDLRINTLGVFVCGTELLALNSDEGSFMNSGVLPKDEASIAVRLSTDQLTASRRPITEVTIETSPMRLLLDTVVIENALEAIGGVAGIIELSNSIAPESVAGSPSSSTRTSKGVRFAGEVNDGPSGPELKLNARIGGMIGTLRGSRCSVVLRTSTLKAVYRELGAVATLEHLSLSGPYDEESKHNAPVSIDLTNIRTEYLVTPQDKDLERLLSLLTPSKDKYENDDDILIDTLLRQRRKGGLLRLSLGLLKFKLEDWNCASSFTALADDLSKLSAVANYLPEDERPGLLTLCRIKEIESQVPVNEKFGIVRIGVHDIHLAQVGLPALLAFSIGRVGAQRKDGPVLIRDLLPPSAVENLPMIMARMLGDEADPTIKIKLFNICVEYNPGLITALTDTDGAVAVEEMVESLIHTVANLTVNEVTPPINAHASPERRLAADLLVHDSALGLTPNELTSKAFFVIADAHFVTKAPSDNVLVARADLRQASCFLTDIADDDGLPASDGKGHVHYAGGRTRVADYLHERGYVSILSIMSASVVVRVREDEESELKIIEVDAKNELLLLETCADSTQTFFATLGALAPPIKASDEPKYLTEPMTIEDMMASFTGDAVEEPIASPPETLFDADQGLADLDAALEYSTLIDDTDGLLAESEMLSSLYGPISGILEMDDDMDGAESLLEKDDFPETAESLLEEDPFEMTITPEDMPIGDNSLMRSLAKQSEVIASDQSLQSLAKQSRVTASDQSLQVELYEIYDPSLDTAPAGLSIVEGGNPFNTRRASQQVWRTDNDDMALPFRLKLRDFHVIWNLYDGYDWQCTRDGIAQAVEQVEQKAEERRARRQQPIIDREDDESIIGDFLFNSIYIGVPADMDAQDIRRQINRHIDDQISETESLPVSAMTRRTYGSTSHPSQQSRSRRRLKLSRSKSHKIAFELKGVSADVLSYPPGKGNAVSRVNLRLGNFEIFDNVPSSTWRKFLTHLNNDPAVREMSKPMFNIEVNTVKTLESYSASELTLHVSVLPLRLHVDQDALDFITRFFEFKDERTITSSSGGEQPFIQRIEVDTVDLCLDYKPKHVDFVGLRSGRTKEFMNFVTLDGANIRLKHAIVYGLRGFDTLHDTLNNVWMPDVTRNQLPTVLAGLAPVRSLVNIGMGVRDVVAIPIHEYKKDGRIVRSIRKGAYQFGKTTASELARFGAKVALGTQTYLSSAEEYLTPSRPGSARPSSARGMPSDHGLHETVSDDEDHARRAVSAYANQPLGVLSGLRSARRHLEHDLLTAKDALIAVQGEVLESRGPGAAAAAVARHAPTVILRPVIGATRAVGTTLLGVGNQIDRSNLRRVEDKYKSRG